MKIEDSHICNLLSLRLLAEYYSADCKEFETYYYELQRDKNFLKEIKKRMNFCRPYFAKGVFINRNIQSPNWFGNQRIVLYILIRFLKPLLCVETGVFYGGTTAFILNALRKNRKGKLISIDLSGNKLANRHFQRHENVGDSEYMPTGLKTGFIIPEYLKNNWQLIEGDSIQELKKIDKFNFFSHDSEHSKKFVVKELEVARLKMPKHSTMLVDDIHWSNGFFEFCLNHRLYPLLLTDNGKFGLKVRLGLVRLDHPNNLKRGIVF